MSLKTQEQLNEALIELKQSQEREARLASENRAILDAISSITIASDKQQIFKELKSVLALYIDFSDFVVLTKNSDQTQYQTLLSSNPNFQGIYWQDSDKYMRALSGECIIFFEPNKLDEFEHLSSLGNGPVFSALITGAKATITDSIILLIGRKAGQFTLDYRDTLSRFRPLVERALTDIERIEQLQQLVDIKTQQLKLAQVKAEKANEAKSRFLAMMSHELRTPLSAVLGYIDVLLADLKQENQLEILEKMESSAELLLVLINDILELSRIESGEFPIKYQWVRLNTELKFVLEHFYALADAKGLKFSVNIEFDESLSLWIDPARVMQIVFNLVGNALKFTHAGEVCLTANVINQHLVITVKDTGIGIDKDRLDIVFSEFKQADDSITRSYGGTGLGLTISKHLVGLMSGNISVKSKLGQGSTFRIELPISSKKIESTNFVQPGHHSCEKRLTVLVVEDTETNQMVIKLVLERLGHRVVIVNNGQKSVDYLKKNASDIDLIFMDISMPVMDGLTATKEIRKFCTDTPVIALTAHAMEQDKQACLNSGMNAFVSKPIRSKEIQRSIKTVLG
ncbi:signal transduction histidine kinase [Vibrio sinaloensis DSM 21326]|uniref:histidine kinase n=1 Tax=Vibrio sinaloensis DSM 21326 TaxID=945550 RepID=E8MAN9_PHOS4|nr:ATP-binding protein [Vibrio sinaloensis]EGA68884.1 signal transduction histidine kinase [Vibrio sinaloensis DSM 21326]